MGEIALILGGAPFNNFSLAPFTSQNSLSFPFIFYVLLQGTGKWYELQDLHVKEIEPQMLTLTESYIQVSK